MAGLAPAALVAVLFVGTGSVAMPDSAIVLGGITVAAMTVGWIVAPLATGSLRADLNAVIAYALVAGLPYLVGGSLRTYLETTAGAAPDVLGGARAVAGQFLYGLFYLPLWAAFLTPFAVVWVVAVRVLRRRSRLPRPEPVPSIRSGRFDGLEAIRLRRVGLAAAAIILGYGLFVAVLPLVLYEDAWRPPWWIYRPVTLFGLFAVPAAVGAIGAVRGVRPLLIAAGVICLLQAFIAFSGVTVGFVVPGIVLLLLGAGEKRPDDAPPRRATMFAGIAVVALTIGAWVSFLGLTEPRCYQVSRAGDGSLMYREVPATDSEINGPTLIAGEGGGCGSAELTAQGMGGSATLAIGAIVLAATSAYARPRVRT